MRKPCGAHGVCISWSVPHRDSPASRLLGRHRKTAAGPEWPRGITRAAAFPPANKHARPRAVSPTTGNRLIRHHESRNHRKRHRWTGLNSMSTSLWCLGIGLLLVRRFGDTAPYLLPVSVIAWGFLWPAVHAGLFRAAAGSFRAQDARRQLHQQTPRRLDGGAI